jgi:hypothetical protein
MPDILGIVLFLFFIIWVLSILLLVPLLFLEYKRAEKQRREMAERLGIEYHNRLVPADQAMFAKFALASRGRKQMFDKFALMSRGRKASNAFFADSGDLRVVIFDFRYIVGKNERNQTCVMAQSDLLSIPEFELSPEGMLQNIAGFFGFQDINFDDDTNFSKAFKLTGPDEDRIRAFFTAKRRQEVLRERQIILEGNGDQFVFHQTGRQLSTFEELNGLMERALSLYAVMRSEPDGSSI